MGSIRGIAVVVVLALGACGSPAKAPVETRAPVVAVATTPTSPGPLIEAHAALACVDCHADGSKSVRNDKCLGCHEHQTLAARVHAARGLHASHAVAGKPCESCHLDHRGAHYDASGWSGLSGGAAAFDHDLSGWKLEGAHAAVACASCHPKPGRWVGADRACGSCHAAKQPHNFAASERAMFACERCHTEGAWAPARSSLKFDHNDRKDAAVALDDAQRAMPCVACHPKSRFKP